MATKRKPKTRKSTRVHVLTLYVGREFWVAGWRGEELGTPFELGEGER